MRDTSRSPFLASKCESIQPELAPLADGAALLCVWLHRRSSRRAIASGRHTAVDRQNDSRDPGGVRQIEDGVGNIFGTAVTPERLQTIERLQLGRAQLTVQWRGDNAGGYGVDSDVVHRQFDGQILRERV